MLLLANFFWGLSFPVVKALLLLHERLRPGLDPWFSAVYTVAPRFILAVLVLTIWYELRRLMAPGRRRERLWHATRAEWRQGVTIGLFAAMGIERDNKEKRQDWVLRGFRQFDAPVSIVVTYDRSIHGGDIAPFDCGGVVNCLVNAAWSRGLGCVINSQGIMQSPVVREQAGIPDDQVIQTCVAMGWPDDDFPANAVVSHRKSLAEAAVFVGFED